ncbi:hypothetical protein GGR57DRAFT_274367 [Xylariaceae sp. FL1272]|nr:hypothetical protein GGR57DRAFT_274367 [Xylariaceae sp. FL1272]
MASRRSIDSVTDTAPLMSEDLKPPSSPFHRPPLRVEAHPEITPSPKEVRVVTMISAVRVLALAFGIIAGTQMSSNANWGVGPPFAQILTWFGVSWNILMILVPSLPHKISAIEISLVLGSGKTVTFSGDDDGDDAGNEHSSCGFPSVPAVDLLLGIVLFVVNVYNNYNQDHGRRRWWDSVPATRISVLWWFNTVFQLIVALLALSSRLQKAHIKFEKVELRPSYAIRLPRDSFDMV